MKNSVFQMMQQYYLVPIFRKECHKKFSHSSKEGKQLKHFCKYKCLIRLFLGMLWDKVYFKEIRPIWVSHNKSLFEKNFKCSEQYILVKKFPTRKFPINQVENLSTRFVILGFWRLGQKFLNRWTCKTLLIHRWIHQ